MFVTKGSYFMCSPYIRKEANKFYWLVKGQLIPTSWRDTDVEKIYDSYMTRLWGNHERMVYGLEGFDQAYAERERNMLNTELENVCVLGYN
jgi:hypothetical protein